MYPAERFKRAIKRGFFSDPCAASEIFARLKFFAQRSTADNVVFVVVAACHKLFLMCGKTYCHAH